MPAFNFKCSLCGFEFSAVVTDKQLLNHEVPCLGCGSHELTVNGEAGRTIIYSREAEEDLHCLCKGEDQIPANE